MAPIVLEALPQPFVAWATSPDRSVAATLGTSGDLLLWRVAGDGIATVERLIPTPAWPDGSPGRLDAIALSKGGRYASLRRPEGGFDLWATDHARRLRTVSGKKDADVWRSAWTPSGDAVLLEADSGRTRLVRLDGRALDLPIAPPWTFTPDGTGVVGGLGKGLALVDLASGRVRRRFVAPAEALPPYAFSSDGRLLASAGEDPGWKGPGLTPEGTPPMESASVHELRIDVWRVADGRLLRSVPGYSSYESDQARLFFVDRRRLAVPDLGKILDAPTGRVVRRFAPWVSEGATLDLPPARDLRPRIVLFPPDPDLGRNVAASPDGKFLVTGESGRETRLLVWDAPNRRLLRRVAVPNVRNLRSVEFAPDGTLVVEGEPPPPKIDAFPLTEERIRVTFRVSSTGEASATSPTKVAPFRGMPQGGMNVAFPAPGGVFAIALLRSWRENRSVFEIARFEAKNGARGWTNADLENPRGPVTISPDGESFAFAWVAGPLRPGMRNTLGIFDAATGRPRTTIMEDAGVDVWRSVFSRDGTRLIVTTSAGIQIRDATTLALLHRVDEAQDSGDVQIAPRPDGGFAAVRRGRDLRLFDREARLLTTLVSFPTSGWAAWTPGGGAWGSPAGLSRLRRVVGDRLLPLVEIASTNARPARTPPAPARSATAWAEARRGRASAGEEGKATGGTAPSARP